MTALDATGLYAMEALSRRLHASGRALVVCGARRQPAKLIRKSQLRRLLGSKYIVAHIQAALHRARTHYEDFNTRQ